MQPLKKSDEDRLLQVVPAQTVLEGDEQSENVTFDGGGGPPSQRLEKDLGALWVIAAFGSALVLTSLLALSNDPAASTFRQTFAPTFGDVRVFCELALLVVGSACIFPTLSVARALASARKVENDAGGRVKSLQVKKLEKVSSDDFLRIVGNYIAAFLR